MKPTITICTKDQYRDIQGIHLLCPDEWYINDALDTADRDGFKTIFCHYECIGTTTYKISSEALNRLIQLALDGHRVSFTHGAK